MKARTGAMFLLCAGAVVTQAAAHHSFAMFDSAKSVQLSGVVREFQWTNPHTWIQLTVQGADGQSEEWSIEGTSPNYLRRDGWTRESLKPGDKIVVVVFPLRDGRRGGAYKSATFADGRPLGPVH